MKTKQYIDEFIAREKQTAPNPFMRTRVMAQIEQSRQPKRRATIVWQSVAVAASLALVGLLGVSIGSRYEKSASLEQTILINDSQIENLSYYHFEDYE